MQFEPLDDPVLLTDNTFTGRWFRDWHKVRYLIEMCENLTEYPRAIIVFWYCSWQDIERARKHKNSENIARNELRVEQANEGNATLKEGRCMLHAYF